MRKLFLFLVLFLLPLTSFAYYYDNYEHYEKSIRINTFAEKLSYYELGKKIGEIDISSGDYENQTPAGRFRVMTKSERMFSKEALKWMPYRMEFYAGEYGIHGLPETYSGKQTSTQEESIGFEAAGACVRVGDDDIKKLYDWVDLGTVVLIAYDLDEYSNKSGKGASTIEKYFRFISEQKLEEAFLLKINPNYSLNVFKNIYNNLEVKINDIKSVNNSKYISNVDLYKNGNLIASGIKSMFFVKNDKIIKSYVIK